MFSIYILGLYAFSSTFVGLDALTKLPQVEANDLIRTEEIIRNCTNFVLSSLNVIKPKNWSRIEELSTIHRFFISVTLEDANNLKKIAQLTRVDKNVDNSTEHLRIILNELLNEDRNIGENQILKQNKTPTNNDADVIRLVNVFIAKLEVLKESYGVNKVFSDINTNILKLFAESNKLNTNKNESSDVNLIGDNDKVIDDNEFWQPSGRRIYKGERTKIKYFPFMASIQIFNIFQCAGSIIKSDLIITASSCLQLAWNNRLYRENPAFLSVRVGSSFYSSGGESIPIMEVYFHPDYDPKNLWNNICLLRLVRHIKFRKKDRRKVQKIMFDKNPWNLPMTTPGVTIIGWGAKGISNIVADPWKNILSYAFLDVYPQKECQEVYTKQYVTKKHFCAGFFSKGGGACNRDVGAPGVVDGMLMGVVSFGSPVCGTPDAPTVFTKLGYYSNWIEQIMEMDVPHRKIETTLKVDFDPFGPYMTTTPYTTTTFKITPLKFGEKAPILANEDENYLRILDDQLFRDFLETMFGSEEVNEYKNIMKSHKYLRGNQQDKDNESENKKPEVEKEDEIPTTEPTSVTHEDEPHIKQYIPLTVGYIPDEDYVSVTEMAVPIDSDVVTDEYVQTEQQTNYIPVLEHTPRMERNMHKNTYATFKQESSTTANTPNKITPTTTVKTQPTPEILLELATGSSDDSSDSELQSNIKDVPFNKSSEESSSVDAGDIPGEQAIAEVLEEIDLNKIIKDVSTDVTIATKISSPNSLKVSQSNKIISTTTAMMDNSKSNTNDLRNNNQPDVKEDKDPVLTLLYLSDSEKEKSNTSAENYGLMNGKKDISSNGRKDSVLRNCDECNKIYNLMPKSQLYEIVSELLSEAITNKDLIKK